MDRESEPATNKENTDAQQKEDGDYDDFVNFGFAIAGKPFDQFSGFKKKDKTNRNYQSQKETDQIPS